MTHIDDKEFETLNWLPMTERFIQCIISIVFKYVNDKYSCHINEVFQTGPENNNQTRCSFQKLKFHFRKTDVSNETSHQV